VAVHANRLMWRFRIKLIIILVIAMVSPLAITVLFLYPPDQHTFYPRCLFNLATGLYCPGCGSTRCLHSLLHGDLLQAFAYNAMLVLTLPYLAWVAWNRLRKWCDPTFQAWRAPAWSLYLLFFVLVAYWILRNVDVYPFTLLAPHRLS
jgi:hypothetical protein